MSNALHWRLDDLRKIFLDWPPPRRNDTQMASVGTCGPTCPLFARHYQEKSDARFGGKGTFPR